MNIAPENMKIVPEIGGEANKKNKKIQYLVSK